MQRPLILFVVATLVLGTLLSLRVQAQQAELLGPAGGSGTIEGTSTRIASRVGGRIIAVHVKEGEQVQPGQAILDFDCAEPDSALAEAEARLEAARQQAEAALGSAGAATHAAGAAEAASRAVAGQIKVIDTQQDAADRQAGRLEALPDDVALAQRDQARATVDVLAAQIDAVNSQRAAATNQAEAARGQADAAAAQARAAGKAVDAGEAAMARVRVSADECHVKASRAGYVQLLPWELGELVAPGATLAVTNDISQVTAAFYLPNADLAAAAPGGVATVKADAWPDRTFEGKVITVASEAEFTPRNIQTRTDRDRLVYKVEVRLDNADGALRPGMPVEVRLTAPAASE